jgi:hypothetical protein
MRHLDAALLHESNAEQTFGLCHASTQRQPTAAQPARYLSRMAHPICA